MQSAPKKIKLDGSVSVWQKILSKREQEDPLPKPFPLPRNFNSKIMEALEKKQLSGPPRKKFLATIAELMHTYKSYPTTKEYDDVACEIVKKWKFLASKNGQYVS